MSENRSQRWPTTGVIIALGLLVIGIQLYHHTSLVEYTYDVATTTQSVATEAAQSPDSHGTVIYQFTELPATAQDAFLRAYESANNQITIRGMENQVSALTATGDTPGLPGGGVYYVVYEGSYYEFTIRQPMSAPGFDTLLAYVFTLSGLLYSLYASFTHKPRARTVLTLASGTACFLGVYGLTEWGPLNNTLSLLAVGALCAYPPAIVVWTRYETLRS